MSPEKRSKSVKNGKNAESLPLIDVYDELGEEDTVFASKSVMRVSSSPKKVAGSSLSEYDEDDEEDFIKIYFASGTVLKPSDEPYDLRSKIHQANRELANDDPSTTVNTPGKVKFDNTVVVLDSFEDIGTVSIGTEKLHGSDVFPDQSDVGRSPRDDDDILAEVDLSRNEEDDQNDVVCSSTASVDKTQETDCTDDKATSSASFSRSFSSESDDPMFINVIESGDEFKAIMDRNNYKAREGAAIDERVTYFPELFTHTQYKMYENSEKTLEDGGREDDAAGVDIYVPKKLDANELRNRLREISKGRKNAQQQQQQQQQQATANTKRYYKAREKPAKKCDGPLQAQKKTKPAVCKMWEKKTATVRNRQPKLQSAASCKPRATYYFELDPKGKLKPLNENNDGSNGGDKCAAKFFRINLKASGNDENAKPRITKTPNADLFLEFQTDRAGNKGAKLIIKKKPTADTDQAAGTSKRLSGGSCGGHERSRLPGYNGLRSEYGLSAEQLLERRRMRMERERQRRDMERRKHEEEQRKRAENEKNFFKWLQQKKQLKKQAKTGRHSYPTNRLTVSSARASINSSHSSNQRKGSFALEELLKMKDENGGSWFKF